MERPVVNLRLLAGLLVFLAAIAVGHELALRAMLDREIAGSLLAVGGDPVAILTAAGTLVLRLFAFGSFVLAPVLVAWRLLGRLRRGGHVSA
jgi:hypothetical protein